MPGSSLRALGFYPGEFAPGPLNSITDVPGVRVGHVTLIEGENVRTGATAILPHGDNLYQDRVPAGIAVANGFGKMAGVTQVQELGELETPILLTHTLAVSMAMEAVIQWTLAHDETNEVFSINAVVGETNDGFLNDIRRRSLTVGHMLSAIEGAVGGQEVREGAVGAGTGTVCMGWKGGIGTSSRQLGEQFGRYTLGVLVQTNFGGSLRVLGIPIDRYLALPQAGFNRNDGSIMIIIATDAPLANRNLRRIAWRAFAGLARTGAAFSNGSGDYALAFSTANSVRRTAARRKEVCLVEDLPNERMSPLFQAVIEATEEAIYNALFMAVDMHGYKGRLIKALPREHVIHILERQVDCFL
ncbi:MAG: P1 family peptidase [Candidatus Promineifilaceae bacterium]|nr:P1 family peptidase [Candidatus Promineifilaceae bacterium]